MVDENNQPRGLSKPRDRAHAEGDWHRVVHIYLLNSKGDFLAHLRSPFKDQKPNRWDARFGGHIPSGKLLEQTVIEELKQEIGLVVSFSDLKSGKVYPRDKGAVKEFSYTFFYIFNGDITTLHFHDNEVVEVKWMQGREVLNDMQNNPEHWAGTAAGFKAILADYEELKIKNSK